MSTVTDHQIRTDLQQEQPHSKGALRVYCTKKNIALAVSLLLALGTIVVGILAKLDKLGVQLPNGFSQDAALGTSFAPIGLMILGAGGKAGHNWKKSRTQQAPDVVAETEN